MRTKLLLSNGVVERDPAIDAWMKEHGGELGAIVFTSHVNVGFFHGAALADPVRLLQGAGKFMPHVKLRPGTTTDTASLSRLI